MLALSLILFVTPAVEAAAAPPRVGTRELTRIAADLETIVRANGGRARADKAEDALGKVRGAVSKLRQGPPDRQAALGELEGAVGDLEAAIKDDLFRPSVGNRFLGRIAGAARQLAVHAISEAAVARRHSSKIAEAEQALAAGDRERAAGRYKDAVAKYRDALSKAEGAGA